MENPSPSKKPPQKVVRCGNCKRYLFTMVITADMPPVGPIAEIRNLRCRCGHKCILLFGSGDIDKRGFTEKVEEKLKSQMNDELKKDKK